MQRIERSRHRAELAETRAAAMSEPAKSDMLEIAQQWRDLAQEIERLEPPREGALANRPMRPRVELVLAVLSATVAVATVAAPRWLELVTGLDPDYGSGGFEWVATIVLLGAALLMSFRARQLHRRQDAKRGR